MKPKNKCGPGHPGAWGLSKWSGARHAIRGAPKLIHGRGNGRSGVKMELSTAMNRLLIVGIVIISTGPLFAQAQPNPAKLKADAQKITSTIRSDKAKTQIYCQLNSLSDQIEEAARAKDARKVETL